MSLPTMSTPFECPWRDTWLASLGMFQLSTFNLAHCEEYKASCRHTFETSCSSNYKEGFAMVDDTLCPYKPDSQTAPYTQPVLDFNTGSQQENSNRKKKWCHEISGLQNLFSHQKRLVGSVCYIIPVCSLPLIALRLICILCWITV